MLNLKDSFTEVLLEAKPMNPDFGDKVGDKTKLLENTRKLAVSLRGAEISRTFQRLPCDVTSCWKRHLKQALKPRVSQLEFGQQWRLVS
ncbi:hypothetical protein AVEN_246298-1 [Araneus ventricosus]|uniref:Uncharacterized protein n=1 Tax=Araneus ventricosus TaxID=182803 RepID=A0A4Y2HV53_ARAVE|nr:hypothetical protein AVEN_246298-1 [Araneus ventricosus]